MKVYHGSSKTGQKFIEKANNAIGYRLEDVYTTFSNEKARAYRYCLEKYISDNNAANFRIISANTFQFSVAWDLLNPDTLEVIGVNIETANNSYLIDLRF